MTEGDARAWLTSRYHNEIVGRLALFAGLIVEENRHQNLVAPSTISQMWSRHFLDSAQLIDWAPRDWRLWVDVGAGAGLPGLVIAILTEKPVILIEPRKLRVDFMLGCIEKLQLAKTSILQSKAATVSLTPAADIVSARAFAKLDMIFDSCQKFATSATTYLLPKGRSAKSEVAMARRSWQGAFHVEQSIVDPTSGVVIASGVSRR